MELRQISIRLVTEHHDLIAQPFGNTLWNNSLYDRCANGEGRLELVQSNVQVQIFRQESSRDLVPHHTLCLSRYNLRNNCRWRWSRGHRNRFGRYRLSEHHRCDLVLKV